MATDPKVPTAEEISEYEGMLQEVIDATAAGEDTTARQKELKAFMIDTGIANEAPVTDFPELTEPASP